MENAVNISSDLCVISCEYGFVIVFPSQEILNLFISDLITFNKNISNDKDFKFPFLYCLHGSNNPIEEVGKFLNDLKTKLVLKP